MQDENAFGLLISYLRIEDDEYSLEREEFVDRALSFRQVLVEYIEAFTPAEGARALDLGHALYLEFAAGDESEDPVVWLKGARSRLASREFESVAVLSYGSRWVAEPAEASPSVETFGTVEVLRVSNVSEPFRKALYVDTATQGDEEDDVAWGAGLYVDTEAVEALGRALKNAPTPLAIGGATFYRMAR
jgi:hypothetical protein